MAIRVNKIDFYVGGKNLFMEYSGTSFKAKPKVFGKGIESRNLL